MCRKVLLLKGVWKKKKKPSINFLSSDKPNYPFVIQKPSTKFGSWADVVAEVDPQQDVINFLKHVAEILLNSLLGIIRYEKKNGMNWNGMKVINTDTSEPDWTTHRQT